MSNINPYTAPQSEAGAEGLRRIPFSPEDERVIGSTGILMMVAGVANLISGAAVVVARLMAIMSVPESTLDTTVYAGGAILAIGTNGLVSVLLGIFLLIGGLAFRKVVTSDEADQEYLAKGFLQLRWVFLIKSIVIIVTIAVVALAFFGFLGLGMLGL